MSIVARSSLLARLLINGLERINAQTTRCDVLLSHRDAILGDNLRSRGVADEYNWLFD